MAIHHDKMAYGKLAPTKKELSEAEILKMLSKLNEETEDADTPPKEVAPEKHAAEHAMREKTVK